MFVKIVTIQTEKSKLHEVNEGEFIMFEEEKEELPLSFPVCLTLEDAAGNVIATSGCYEEFPILSQQFVEDWFNNEIADEINIEIVEGNIYYSHLQHYRLISEEYYFTNAKDLEILESEELLRKNKDSYIDFINSPENQLPTIPSEIHTSEPHFDEADKPYQAEDQKDLFYSQMNQAEQEIENKFGKEFVKTSQQFEDNMFENIDNFLSLDNLSKEIDREIDNFYAEIEYSKHKKHILIKRSEKREKVNFFLLQSASSDIWNGGYISSECQCQNETVMKGQIACENLELFLKMIANSPAFAQKAHYELSKLFNHDKNRA